jgi:TM2 domain-containing membrane protein YozV
MPLPFIIAGVAVAAGIYGASKHSEASKTNQRAKETQEEAQHIFNEAKLKLENAQKNTKNSLIYLGKSKQQVMMTTFSQFCESFRKIKNLEVQATEGLNELSRFTIDEQEAIQMRELADVNANNLSTAAAGAAAGTMVALAASGFAPVVGTLASGAGAALVAGEFTLAGGLAGSAATVGLAATPLAAIAGPALMFSGLSASNKAHANLDKAQSTLSEAQAQAEKMETVVVTCNAIAQRADMFQSLLQELNMLFGAASGMMTDMVNKKTSGFFASSKVNVKKLSEREKELIAVTRSLAGAVKAVLDTPMLSSEGKLTKESQAKYEEIHSLLPAYQQKVAEVQTAGYEVVAAQEAQPHTKKHKSKVITVVLALLLGAFGVHRFYLKSWKIGFCFLIATIAGLLIPWCVIFSLLDMLYFLFMGKEKFHRKFDIS